MRIAEQVAKDSELMLKNRLNTVTWHFLKSPVKGRGGPSAVHFEPSLIL